MRFVVLVRQGLVWHGARCGRFLTLHYMTLHYITSHHILSYHIILRHVTLRYIILHHITLHSLRFIALRYITLRYITLCYVTLHYSARQLRYFTLHRITLHHPAQAVRQLDGSTDRFWNASLGGGSLLDMGSYLLMYASAFLGATDGGAPDYDASDLTVIAHGQIDRASVLIELVSRQLSTLCAFD